MLGHCSCVTVTRPHYDRDLDVALQAVVAHLCNINSADRPVAKVTVYFVNYMYMYNLSDKLEIKR